MSKQKTLKPEIVFCAECERLIKWSDLPKYRRDQWTKNQRTYCSKECAKEYCRKLASQTMARTNRKYASERMTKKNPMRKKEAREKMRKTLIQIGHKPAVRGGNGRGMTEPQRKLMHALSHMDPEAEHIVLTNVPRVNEARLPTHYKIDIAIPKARIAIEVDGASHCSTERQAQDRKKDAFLMRSGWKVLRFSNAEVMANTKKCVQIVESTT